MLKASTNTHFNNFRGKGRGRGGGDQQVRDSSKNFKGNNDQFQGKEKGKEHMTNLR